MLHSSPTGSLWAIVLAAGEGTRLAGVTRAVYGRPVPKQFAVLGGSRTFLQRTMDLVGSPDASSWLDTAYVGLAKVDLSRDILQQARGLRVVPMVNAGWSDCGTPERLLRSLDTREDRQWLCAQLEGGNGAESPAAAAN